MKKIIIGASRPVNFKIGAELIMWWEETKASHVYCCIERSTGKKMVYHAIGAGTCFWGYDKFKEINKPIYEKEIEIPDEVFDPLVDKLIDRLDTQYSIMHLFGLFLKRLVQYTSGKIIENPFKDKDKTEICIEALCMVIDLGKIERVAEDPEDMGMYEAMIMLKVLKGKEVLSG